MNEKALVLSIIFLAASLVVPMYALFQYTVNTNETIRQIPNLADETALNEFLASQAAGQQILLIIVAIIEVILVAGFALSFWYAIRCTKGDKCLNFPTP